MCTQSHMRLLAITFEHQRGCPQVVVMTAQLTWGLHFNPYKNKNNNRDKKMLLSNLLLLQLVHIYRQVQYVKHTRHMIGILMYN